MWRKWFYILSVLVIVTVYGLSQYWAYFVDLYVVIVPLILIGTYDILQKKRNILRNYPIVGHFRYLFLGIRPEIQQYFIETDQDGKPFSKEQRELVYQRANKTLDTLPFGTQSDVYASGYESLSHSLAPTKVLPAEARLWVGGGRCQKPYLASRINISAMSFGALSKNAILALNRGAKLGGFLHNTGEGGLSPYHLQEGGDLTWQIGTGCFGCRTVDGDFDPKQFALKVQHDQVKMIEIKLSQGAKPGHGGVLPGVKVTAEIAEIRGLAIGKDVISPPAFKLFTTPRGLCEFIQQLRELSGGKPVGFKLCIGQQREFFSICKAMLATDIYPDFITVDGSEGGTGAAPLEFTDSIGMPLNDALVFVHNALVGTNLREHIRVIASGKIISGFDVAVKVALGADMCNIARGMMFALGCIQSRRCNKNTCPTGIATQDPARMYALDIDHKAPLVANYHRATIESFLEVLGAAGVRRVKALTPNHINRRLNPGAVKPLDQVYTFIAPGSLLAKGQIPEQFAKIWHLASAEKF